MLTIPKRSLKLIKSRAYSNRLDPFSGTFMKKSEDQKSAINNLLILVSQKEMNKR